MRTVVSGINNVQIQTGGGEIWTFGSDGNLTFPNGDLTIGSDLFGAPAIIGAAGKNISMLASGVGDGYEVSSSIGWVDSITEPTKIAAVSANNPLFAGAGDVGIVTGDYFYTGNTNVWNFGADGSLAFPNALSNTNSQIYTTNGGYQTVFETFGVKGTGQKLTLDFDDAAVKIQSQAETEWKFGQDGNIVLPGTASILSDNVMTLQSGDTLFLRSDAGGVGIYSGNSQLSTTSDLGIEAYADSINLTPNAQGAVLIDINNTNAFVEISGPVGSWMFTGDGNLTLPTGGTINYSDGSNALVGGTTSPPNYASLAQSVVVTPPTFGNGGGGQLRVDVNAVVVSSNVNISNVGFMITALGTGSSGVGLLAEGTPATGVQTIQINGISGVNQTYYVSAFVTSQLGTTWSEVYLATSGICLIAGTMITLADGTKKAIEHITYSDTLLAWDFDQGKFTTAKPLWIKQGETGGAHNKLTFSDGTVLRTFDQHRIFNKQWGAFTYPMTDNTPLGTLTFNEHGDEVMLVNKEQVFGPVEYYNVITDRHINLFSDSILTSCRLNNAYPIVDMQFNKTGRTLRDASEFVGIDARWIAGLRLCEQTYSADDMRWYVARLERLDIAQLDSDQSVAA